MTSSNIITIDGFAASGKGTVAKRLANHLDYFYLDTGKIYRIVGLNAYQNGIVEPMYHTEDVVHLASTLSKTFSLDLVLNPELASDIAGQMASKSAAIPDVREAVLNLQKNLAQFPPGNKSGSVLDGRDCGTVIAPNAIHKFFITADLDIRAKRRFDELSTNDPNVNYHQILEDMRIRDERDTNRTDAPLKPAKDAITIDTTHMSADEVFEKILSEIH